MPRSLCSAQLVLGDGFRASAATPFAATMRPRSIGTRSSVARGACARLKARRLRATAAGAARERARAGDRAGHEPPARVRDAVERGARRMRADESVEAAGIRRRNVDEVE